MPTPSPIIAASTGAKLAVSKTWVPRVTRLIPTPSANSAVTIGNPIATTEPKVIRRTTIAASRPMKNEESPSSCSASWIGLPPSSTSSPSPSAPWAIAMIFRVWSLLILLPATSYWIVA